MKTEELLSELRLEIENLKTTNATQLKWNEDQQKVNEAVLKFMSIQIEENKRVEDETSTYKLRDLLPKQDHTVTRIMNKARKHGITFDSMARNKNGDIVPTVFFQRDEWIQKQKEHIEIMREDYKVTNIKLLKLVESL